MAATRIGAPAAFLWLLAAIDLWLTMSGALAGMDRTLLLALAAGRAAGLWLAITHCGDPWVRLVVAVATAIALRLQRRGRVEAVLMMAGVMGGLLISSVLKDLVARPRPALLPHLDPVSSWSWPSGHALNGSVVYLLAARLLPPARSRWLWLAAAGLLCLGIGLSRIALAVHWPTDVIAGWALGGGWAWLVGGLLLRRREAPGGAAAPIAR